MNEWRSEGAVINEPVDFALITTLRAECDAVLRHLEQPQPIQEPNDPHTYYIGYVTVPKSGERFTVVVVMLLGMGNDVAATTTTRLIRRWQPRHVIAVGIAGGVRGKVSLGDVIVADFVYYYELAKVTPNGEERRPQQFPSARMLYGRAIAYKADDWKSSIVVERPNSFEAGNAPALHFGAIGSGEKVVADESTLSRLLGECPKLLAVAMEGAGVARAAAYEIPSPHFLEVRSISDFADSQKNDDWQEYAADVAAAFAIGFLKSGPVPTIVNGKPRGATASAPLLILSAQSMRAIGPNELLRDLGDDLQPREVRVVSLDFTDLVTNSMLTKPATAVQRLVAPQGVLLEALAQLGDNELAFHGLVHIPLAVLMGFLVTDRQPVRLYDFHPGSEPETWAWPDDGSTYPSMTVLGLPDGPMSGAMDVVIRVSISYPVLPVQSRDVITNPSTEIDLTLPHPERSIVRSQQQVREYGRVFRSTLDVVAHRISGARRVHLFYAGPVALAFHLGQQISGSIHPPVVVWNYRRGYEWAIDLLAATLGETCIVHSRHTAVSEGEST